jgi:hypothetical protein
MAVSVAYFSVLQIPALYETLYWRAGMTSHFAPLVFIPFFGVFLLRQIKLAEQRPPSLWIQAVCFLSPFLIGGFSEPPTALMVTILTLAIFAVWQWGRRGIPPFHPDHFAVGPYWRVICTDSNGARPSQFDPFTNAALPVWRSSFSGSSNSHLTLLWIHLSHFLLPRLFPSLCQRLLFYVKFAYFSPELSKETRNSLGIILLVTPLLAYMLIAASFAPSAYGQSYPVARARFIGRLLLTSALMLEGALLGILVAQIRTRFFRSIYVRGFAMLALILLAFYPLRTAWLTSMQIPAYQQRAAAWDARDSEIRTLEAQGVRDLVVRFLSEEQIQDLGDHTGFRLNRCAAALYNVDSIVAFPMGDE